MLAIVICEILYLSSARVNKKNDFQSLKRFYISMYRANSSNYVRSLLK